MRSLIKKSHLVIVVLLFFVYSSKAQECKLQKNEVDAFTDLEVKITEPLTLVRINGQPMYVKAQSIGNNKYLKIRMHNYSEFDFQEDKEITFVLSNLQEVILFPRPMPIDSTKIDNLTNVSTLMVYKLSDIQFENLSNYPVLSFKYYLDTGWVEEKIKDKNQGSIMEILNCIKQ